MPECNDTPDGRIVAVFIGIILILAVSLWILDRVLAGNL